MFKFNQTNRTNTHNTKNNIKGFTLLECAIAAILVTIALGSLMKLVFAVIKNTTFDQKVADSKVFIAQKNTDLFKDLPNQVAKIPVGQTKIGSVDPTVPMTGYYDFLNESGCLLVSQSGGTGGGKTTGLGSTDTGAIGGALNTIDCSNSTVANPSTSTVARYRRQWMMIKDFPLNGDVSMVVTIVYQQTNQVADTSIITKTDGSNTK